MGDTRQVRIQLFKHRNDPWQAQLVTDEYVVDIPDAEDDSEYLLVSKLAEAIGKLIPQG